MNTPRWRAMSDTYTFFTGSCICLLVFDNSFTNLARLRVAYAYLGQSYPIIIIMVMMNITIMIMITMMMMTMMIDAKHVYKGLAKVNNVIK